MQTKTVCSHLLRSYSNFDRRGLEDDDVELLSLRDFNDEEELLGREYVEFWEREYDGDDFLVERYDFEDVFDDLD